MKHQKVEPILQVALVDLLTDTQRLREPQTEVMLADGNSFIVSHSEAAEFCRRERLTVISTREMLRLRSHYVALVEPEALEPTEGEAAGVRIWQRVARVQERFRASAAADTWTWWREACRRCRNCPPTAEKAIAALDRMRSSKPSLTVDWLGLLRSVVSGDHNLWPSDWLPRLRQRLDELR